MPHRDRSGPRRSATSPRPESSGSSERRRRRNGTRGHPACRARGGRRQRAKSRGPISARRKGARSTRATKHPHRRFEKPRNGRNRRAESSGRFEGDDRIARRPGGQALPVGAEIRRTENRGSLRQVFVPVQAIQDRAILVERNRSNPEPAVRRRPRQAPVGRSPAVGRNNRRIDGVDHNVNRGRPEIGRQPVVPSVVASIEIECRAHKDDRWG